jgi:hypothetical protein
MPEQSTLDARLAEIDRRLRTIQSGLVPPPDTAAGGAPASSPTSVPPLMPPPAPMHDFTAARLGHSGTESAEPRSRGEDLAEVATLIGELRELTAAHERLLSSSRDLLSTMAGALARQHQAEPAPAPAAPVGPAPAGAAAAGTVSLEAGPFADTASLRRFERALTALPEVSSAAVREYTRGDRVIVDVHLSSAIS